MVKIALTSGEIELLDLCYKTMSVARNYAVYEDYIAINGDELENLDIMLNCVLDTFLCVGLNENDEPNDMGFELEKLNEKVNHQYVLLNNMTPMEKRSMRGNDALS